MNSTTEIDYKRNVKPLSGAPNILNAPGANTLEAVYGGETLDNFQRYANQLYVFGKEAPIPRVKHVNCHLEMIVTRISSWIKTAAQEARIVREN